MMETYFNAQIFISVILKDTVHGLLEHYIIGKHIINIL